jgi:hypothetical protein
VGPLTGQRYRFDGPGAIVAIDEKDEPSFRAIPNLRRVKSPEPNTAK